MKSIPSSQLFAMGGRHGVLQLLQQMHRNPENGEK